MDEPIKSPELTEPQIKGAMNPGKNTGRQGRIILRNMRAIHRLKIIDLPVGLILHQKVTVRHEGPILHQEVTVLRRDHIHRRLEVPAIQGVQAGGDNIK